MYFHVGCGANVFERTVAAEDLDCKTGFVATIRRSSF
jgi:hypothetical protein